MTIPALVELHIWTVPVRAVPWAFWRMATDPALLGSVPGLLFSRSLGTGAGRSFTLSDADLRRWVLLTCWSHPQRATALTPTLRRWRRAARTTTTVRLLPLSSHGRWSGHEPFGNPRPQPWDGQIAAITRARVRVGQWNAFQRAIPPVADTLDGQPGLQFRMGIGEAPVGLQGTFSVWSSSGRLTDFAYRQSSHVEVIRRTREADWYTEELFARFGVLEIVGDPLW